MLLARGGGMIEKKKPLRRGMLWERICGSCKPSLWKPLIKRGQFHLPPPHEQRLAQTEALNLGCQAAIEPPG